MNTRNYSLNAPFSARVPSQGGVGLVSIAMPDIANAHLACCPERYARPTRRARGVGRPYAVLHGMRPRALPLSMHQGSNRQ